MSNILSTDNLKRAGAGLRKFLGETTSRVAEETAKVLLPEPVKPTTRRLGKPQAFGRRIIDYRRDGPFLRQVGTRWVHGEAHPIMQRYFTHNYLHATKGWRSYVGGDGMRIPQPRAQWHGAYAGRVA